MKQGTTGQRKTRALAAAFVALVAVALAWSCGSTSSDGGTNTNWVTCDTAADCHPGVQCVTHRCVSEVTDAGAGGAPPTDSGSGSAPGTGGAISDPTLIRSPKTRQATSLDPSVGANVVAGNTLFALDVYGKLRATPGNLAYSPLSLSLAMGMVWAGATGVAATEIANTFHFADPQSDTEAALGALDFGLDGTARGVTLHLANSLWFLPDSGPKAPFLDTLAVDYGTGVHVVDLTNGAVAAPVINGWASEQTEGKITSIVAPNDFVDSTRMAVANAIYLKAPWATPFDPAVTAPADFHGVDGAVTSVPTMRSSLFTGYTEGANYRAVALPYANGRTSLLLVLPDDGALDAFEGALDPTELGMIVSGLANYDVDLALPRFSIAQQMDFESVLKGLGMSQIFSDVGSDFASMADRAPTLIQHVEHEAVVSADEKGTSAAGTTVVILGVDGAASLEASAPPSATFHADHPFLFFIRDTVTGSLLFVGRVEAPS